ncbi:MAG: hypothetical protein ABSG41_23790 [Bryobacteraceae bacterium]|jgi:hypothetical protein
MTNDPAHTRPIGLDPHVIRKIAEEQALFFLGSGYAAAYGQLATPEICDKFRTAITLEASRHGARIQSEAADSLAAAGKNDLARLAQIYDHYHGTDAAKQYIASLLTRQDIDLAAVGVIADLPLSTVVTTNFDLLIELAFNNQLDVCFEDEQRGTSK